jgi:hypothetical protein
MLDSGESQREVIRPDFNRAIMIDFQGAQITSDTGFLLLREIDERFSIIDPMRDCLEDLRSPAHTKHSLVEMVRQRVYQIAACYEDCNDADFLRIDPALRLAIGKDHKVGASQSMLSRFAVHKAIDYQERRLTCIKLWNRGPQKPFFDCGGHGCRIISDNRDVELHSQR